jgi:methylated-DNA-[protein]-cysteine S-methyltransferase
MLTERVIPSPIGSLRLRADERALLELCFDGPEPTRASQDAHAVLDRAEAELEEYFAGRRTEFTVPLRMASTSFFESVWQAVATIPFGETRSYADVARAIGRPSACRAVGMANGRNPLPLIVPCHRVVGANGTLTGYGGGLDRKRWLLEHEQPR